MGDRAPSDVAPSLPSLPDVAREIASCTTCAELAATRTRTVPGAFPAGARLLLVGEAPGAEEDAAGEPFVGRSGRLLDELLGLAGVDRSDVAIANVLKCRPPANRAPRRAEIDACRPWLERQVRLAGPRVVLAMGATAATWFFGSGARIAALRGSAHARDGYDVLVTYHPSAALRFGPGGAPLAALRDDLAQAVRLAGGPSRR